MGLFGAADERGGEGEQKAPLYNMSHISYIDETWHSHILPKEDPKNM